MRICNKLRVAHYLCTTCNFFSYSANSQVIRCLNKYALFENQI
jgi:hypothetical protein